MAVPRPLDATCTLEQHVPGEAPEPAVRRDPAGGLILFAVEEWRDAAIDLEGAEACAGRQGHVEVSRVDASTPLCDPRAAARILGFTPDSRALLFTREMDDAINVWRQPIDGSAAVQVTFFSPGQDITHRVIYTNDRSRLMFLRDDNAPGEVLRFGNFR